MGTLYTKLEIWANCKKHNEVGISQFWPKINVLQNFCIPGQILF